MIGNNGHATRKATSKSVKRNREVDELLGVKEADDGIAPEENMESDGGEDQGDLEIVDNDSVDTLKGVLQNQSKKRGRRSLKPEDVEYLLESATADAIAFAKTFERPETRA